MSIEYVVGDVREQPVKNPDDCIKIIPHCCNDMRAMGAGVAAALYTKWPEVREVYMNGSMELGKCSRVAIEEDSTVIVNMIGQHETMIGRNENGIAVGSDGRPPVRYEALLQAMKYVRYLVEDPDAHNNDPDVDPNDNLEYEIHCPLFGCDLAGGDWRVVSALIEEMWTPYCRVLCCVFDDTKMAEIDDLVGWTSFVKDTGLKPGTVQDLLDVDPEGYGS